MAYTLNVDGQIPHNSSHPDWLNWDPHRPYTLQYKVVDKGV